MINEKRLSMKKTIIMVLAFCCFAFGNNPKVAVYMQTPEPKGSKLSHNMVTSKVVESITQGRIYAAADHTADVLKELRKDNKGRELEDHQIKFMGRMFKAQYFCVIDVTPRMGGKKNKNLESYEFRVRLFEVASGNLINSSTASTTTETRSVNEEIMRVSRQAVREIEVAGFAQAEAQQLSARSSALDNMQEKPRIAVYVAGGGGLEDNEKRAAQTIILDGLVRSGVYRTIERSDAFVEELTREQVTQRSGSVDEKQVVALGRRAGAQYICIVDVTDAFGSSQMSARIIDVQTAEVLSTGVSNTPILTLDDLNRASAEVIEKMLGRRPRAPR